jgi:hypothetical protein
MIRNFGETKEFPGFAGAVFSNAPTPPRFYREQIQLPAALWRKFLRPRPISDTQINVIKETLLQGGRVRQHPTVISSEVESSRGNYLKDLASGHLRASKKDRIG